MNTKQDSIYTRMGGQSVIDRWIDLFYDSIPDDAVLKPLFTDTDQNRNKQKLFMAQFLGGPQLYTQHYGKPFLRYAHRHIRIGQAEHDAWLKLSLSSLSKTISEQDLIDEVDSALRPIAKMMINSHPTIKDSYYFNSDIKENNPNGN